MIEIHDLPHVIASLDALMVVTLLTGYRFIRTGNKEMHKRCMLTAVGISVIFLIVYAYYKANSGFAKFGGEGDIRTFYFSFLAVHVLAAAASLFLVPVTLLRAIRERFDIHKKIARWTLPVWLYVGVTGVAVYVMAIHIYPYQGEITPLF